LKTCRDPLGTGTWNLVLFLINSPVISNSDIHL
jgi:hypothetical protein